MKKAKGIGITCKYCKYFKYDVDYKKQGLGFCENLVVQNMLIFGHCDSFFIDENFGCRFMQLKTR